MEFVLGGIVDQFLCFGVFEIVIEYFVVFVVVYQVLVGDFGCCVLVVDVDVLFVQCVDMYVG